MIHTKQNEQNVENKKREKNQFVHQILVREKLEKKKYFLDKRETIFIELNEKKT